MSSASPSTMAPLSPPMALVGIDRGYASCASYAPYKRAFRAAFTQDQAPSSSAASLLQRVTHPKYGDHCSSQAVLGILYDRCVTERASVDRGLTAINKHLAIQPPRSEPQRSHKVWITDLFCSLRGLQNHTTPEKFWRMEVVQRALNSVRYDEPPEIQKLWNEEVLSLLCPKDPPMKSNPYHALFDEQVPASREERLTGLSYSLLLLLSSPRGCDRSSLTKLPQPLVLSMMRALHLEERLGPEQGREVSVKQARSATDLLVSTMCHARAAQLPDVVQYLLDVVRDVNRQYVEQYSGKEDLAAQLQSDLVAKFMPARL
ncbi:MAG: hypothetical protein ACOYKZ_02225 [Chlamydiia bacterium]